jgi:hypothetical protein
MCHVSLEGACRHDAVGLFCQFHSEVVLFDNSLVEVVLFARTYMASEFVVNDQHLNRTQHSDSQWAARRSDGDDQSLGTWAIEHYTNPPAAPDRITSCLRHSWRWRLWSPVVSLLLLNRFPNEIGFHPRHAPPHQSPLRARARMGT